MRFVKMHGLGNDYIYLDGIDQDLDGYDLPRLSGLLSDRHFGVGGDGIILILKSASADFRMRMFNPDGSESEMCGNGFRCFARYVYEHGHTDKTGFVVETGAGLIRPSLTIADGKVQSVRVDMGEPRLRRGEIPMTGPADEPAQNVIVPLDDCQYTATCVSMGNPHCVIFVDEITDEMVLGQGPIIEHHPLFPRRTNVEFAQVLSETAIRMRVWERGAGETLACGTGACGTAVAAVLGGHCGRGMTLHLVGGDLQIEWSEADNHVYQTGPATNVCAGEVDEELIAPAVV